MAKSGVFSTSIKSGQYRLKGEWMAVQSIANNESTVTVDLYLEGDYALYVSSRTATTITIDGTVYPVSAPAISSSSSFRVKLGTATKVIKHNDNGDKSITMSAYYPINAKISDVQYTSMTASSGTVVLDTIPRASAITSFPSFTICGSETSINVSIGMDIKVPTFTHDLVLKHGTTMIASRTGITSANLISGIYTLTLSIAEQNAICACIPNSPSGTVTLTFTTKSGTTQIGDPYTKSATATVSSNVVPYFSSLTAVEANSIVNTTVGLFVQNLSKFKFTINGAVGAKSSTISAYKIEFDGAVYAAATVTTGTITKSGTLPAKATVTDSRGRTYSRTINVSLLAYSPPTITAFDVKRCGATGLDEAMGIYANVIRNISVSSLKNGTTEKNSMTYKIYTRLRGTTIWIERYSETFSSLSSSGSKVLGNGTTLTFDATLAYDFRIDVIDKFNTTISVDVLSTGEVTMSWGSKNVSIGKVWERGALDLKGDSYFDGDIACTGAHDGNIRVKDIRDTNPIPNDLPDKAISTFFNNMYGDTWLSGLSVKGWSTNYQVWQLGCPSANTGNEKIKFRTGRGSDWNPWRTLWHDGNFNPADYIKWSDWNSDKAYNGFVKTPNGLIIQWGRIMVPANASSVAVTYPIRFPTNTLIVSPTNVYHHSPNFNWSHGGYSASGFTAFHRVTNTGAIPSSDGYAHYIAIGY